MTKAAQRLVSFLDNAPQQKRIKIKEEKETLLLVLPYGFFGRRTPEQILDVLERTRFIQPCSQDTAPRLRIAYANGEQPYGEELAVVHRPINAAAEFLTVGNVNGGSHIIGSVVASIPERMRPVVSFVQY